MVARRGLRNVSESDRMMYDSYCNSSGETHLGDRREKVMLDLTKLMTKVEEFNDCGDMDMMQQYVKDVMQVIWRSLLSYNIWLEPSSKKYHESLRLWLLIIIA